MESQGNTNTSSVVVRATDQAETIISTTETLSPFYRQNMTPDRRSYHSVIYCRICHEDSGVEELIDPCECTGTLGLIHASCLETWLAASNTDRCEICRYPFVIERKTKSFFEWLKSKSVDGQKRIVSDVICFIILTPLCFGAACLCGIVAHSCTWITSWQRIGLIVISSLLVIFYFLWVIITIRSSFISLREWRKRNPDIRLIVKHKSEAARIKTYWIVNNDRNNNVNNNNNYCSACLFAPFDNSNDPLYNILQQTTFV